MHYMMTKNDWTTSQTSLASTGLYQLNQTSFGAIPVQQNDTVQLLIINPSEQSQEIQLTFQEAVNVLLRSATVVSLAALSYFI